MQPNAPELAAPIAHAEVNVTREVMNFLGAVRRRRRLMVLALAVAVAAGGLYYAIAQRIFESRASLLVLQSQPDTLSTKMSGDPMVKDLMDTYRSMLSSDAVIGEALKSLQPEDRVDLGDGAAAAQIERLRKNLKVTAVRRTNILEISYRSQSPQAAAMIVDAVLNAYLKFMDKLHRSTARELLDLLTREKTGLEQELKAKEDELLGLKRRMDDVLVREGDKDVSIAAKRLLSLNEFVLKARAARLEAESQLVAIQSAIRNGEDLQPYMIAMMENVGQEVMRSQLGVGLMDTYSLARVNEQIIHDRAELQSAQQRLGPNHSKVRELTDRVQLAEQFLRDPRYRSSGLLGMEPSQLGPVLLSIAKQRFQATSEHESLETAGYEREKTAARSLQGDIAQLEVLNLDLGRLRRFYDLLVTRIKDIDISKDDGMIRTAVLSTPEVPLRPVRPSLPLVGLIALVAGLAGGLGLVYFVEMLDDRFGSIEEMRAQLGNLPVLGMVRKLEPLEGSGLEAIHVHARPQAAENEAFRTLRTALAFVGDGARSVAVTSSEPGDGKTTIIANLAAALAQSSKRTLLIDADIRRPKLTPLFGLRGQQGLTTLLRQDTPVAEVIQANLHLAVMPDLDILPSGPRAADAAELLAGERFSEIISWAESRYDCIFIDSPPAFVSDAALVGRLVDGMMLVVRPEKNQRKTVIRTVDMLATMGVKLLGLVVNHFAVEESKYYGYEYGYGYGYSYDYGYGSEEEDDEPDGEPGRVLVSRRSA